MLQSVRGMSDVLPGDIPAWQFLECVLSRLVLSYGYQEIRFPLLEKTVLFQRSVGAVTDIVQKEMYSFEDAGGEAVSLRPEGTAGCVRAAIQHSLFRHQIQRLWYMGPMFRRERPQKGRYRQFHQFGAELFGVADIAAECELILMGARLWKELGIADQVTLQINSLGATEDRAAYRHALVEYFTQHYGQLDLDSQRRLETNPLRILDSKVPALQPLIAEAPTLLASLGAKGRAYFERLQRALDQLGVNYTVNPHLVRGLDYYGYTVFEWVTDCLGTQGTICAGGRYDNLVQDLGAKVATPAVGFSLGLERVLLLLQSQGISLVADPPDLYCVYSGTVERLQSMVWAERVRTQWPDKAVLVHMGDGNLKNQLKHADRSGARWVMIFGESEVASDKVTLKDLRSKNSTPFQKTVTWSELQEIL